MAWFFSSLLSWDAFYQLFSYCWHLLFRILIVLSSMNCMWVCRAPIKDIEMSQGRGCAWEAGAHSGWAHPSVNKQRWCVTVVVMSFVDDYAQLCNIPVTGRRRPYGRDALVDFSEQYAPEADPYFVQDRKQHSFSYSETKLWLWSLVRGSQNAEPGNL